MVYFSLIVPIYNVENYLYSCLKSIFIQLPKDDSVEVIFVNDGSTDNSYNILENFLEKIDDLDKYNIKIIFQKNQGLSVARNKGVFASSSEYVAFLDSDDILLDGYFSEVLMVLKSNYNIDLIKFKYCFFYDPEKMVKVASTIIFKGVSVIDRDFMIKMLNDSSWYAWLHIYKKNNLLKNPFPKNINFEDAFTIPYIIEESKKCFILDKYLYGYRKREDSITSSYNQKVINQNIHSLKYLVLNFLKKAKEGSEYSYIMYIFFLRVYFSYLIKHKNYKAAKIAWNEVKNNEYGLGSFNKELFIKNKHKIYYYLYLNFGFYSNYIIVIIGFVHGLIFNLLRKMKV
ncbi:Glycosyltransferase involved in cell wall bisynthesis [Acinetobacter kookii]|uniref:Glycosyltransferase involved in cell wall bisynthesis n=1 Tax=Acinetobacter kookii TaxID=1226327 RepID=A0A1G6MID0_9GAMM|nr:glycosyltransferase family A protein [Acinetobacter kookii]SDC55211.1 Glycosyltransferase involved in cell wall bisynthesis [Acinetobacter kookii]